MNTNTNKNPMIWWRRCLTFIVTGCWPARTSAPPIDVRITANLIGSLYKIQDTIAAALNARREQEAREAQALLDLAHHHECEAKLWENKVEGVLRFAPGMTDQERRAKAAKHQAFAKLAQAAAERALRATPPAPRHLSPEWNTTKPMAVGAPMLCLGAFHHDVTDWVILALCATPLAIYLLGWVLRVLAIAKADRALRTVTAIEYLRRLEGDEVRIPCDNPSFDGPNSAVECNGEWTGWRDHRFTGPTLLDALEEAVAERRRRLAEPGGVH